MSWCNGPRAATCSLGSCRYPNTHSRGLLVLWLTKGQGLSNGARTAVKLDPVWSEMMWVANRESRRFLHSKLRTWMAWNNKKHQVSFCSNYEKTNIVCHLHIQSNCIAWLYQCHSISSWRIVLNQHAMNISWVPTGMCSAFFHFKIMQRNVKVMTANNRNHQKPSETNNIQHEQVNPTCCGTSFWRPL